MENENDNFFEQKDTFGESFDERDDVSESNATAKYYQSHMRKFFENGHDKTKGLGEIQMIT